MKIWLHSLFFYFNKGSLDTNEIIKQFIDVLLVYDAIGVNICGLVCDGGGSNERFMHKVTDDLNLDKKKPDNTLVSLIHPLDKERNSSGGHVVHIQLRCYVTICTEVNQMALEI